MMSADFCVVAYFSYYGVRCAPRFEPHKPCLCHCVDKIVPNEQLHVRMFFLRTKRSLFVQRSLVLFQFAIQSGLPNTQEPRGCCFVSLRLTQGLQNGSPLQLFER